MRHIKPILAPLFVVLLCITAYWDIASFQDTLKWDMMDCYYPWRFFVGECVKHQVFPLWNPYQHLGYPIHADMRSVYYPEGFLVGLMGGYRLPVLHFLFIFYISMAGIGIYRLAENFAENKAAKLTVAAAYVLCGFFVGHGQEMFGIIAATWIPWVLHYFIRFQSNHHWANLWKLAFFLFLQLTGGYQALSLILFYLLALLFVVLLIKNYREKQKSTLVSAIRMNLLLGLMVLLSMSVLLVTYMQVSPQVERLTGLSLDDSNVGLLTPQALISIVAPFSVATDEVFLGTNITMANVYVGILMLAFYLLGCMLRKSALLIVIWLFGAITLLASLGPHTPVREFLYDFVPGMNLFRMSSFFSYFSQLSFLLVAGMALDRALNNPLEMTRKLLIASTVVVLGALTLIISTYVDSPEDSGLAFGHLFEFLPSFSELTYHQRLTYQSCVQLAVMLVFMLMFSILRKRKVALSILILVMVVSEMTMALRLNFSSTVGGGFIPSEMQADLEAQPDGFPLPNNDFALRRFLDSKGDLDPLWHNTNIFSKTISADGFNSFRLDRFENYRLDHATDFNESLKHPLVYSPTNSTKIVITDFGPNRIACLVSSEDETKVILQQTYYPGWQVQLNGERQPFALHNNIFPIVSVAKGEYTLVFEYKNDAVLAGFAASYFMLLVFALGFIYHLFLSRTSPQMALIGTGITTILLLGGLGARWLSLDSPEEARKESYERLTKMMLAELSKNSLVLLSVDKPDEIERSMSNKEIGQLLNVLPMKLGELSSLDAALRDAKAETVIYAGSGFAEDRLLIELISEHYSTQAIKRNGKEFVHIFSKGEVRQPIFSSAIDYEKPNSAWNYQESQFDSNAKAHAGAQGWSIHSHQMGSPGLAVRIGDVTDKNRLKLVYRTWCMVPAGAVSDAGLFIQLERKGQEPWMRAINLNERSPKNGSWFLAAILVEPEFDLKPDDVLKMFVWGGEGEPIYLDDQSFAIYAAD